MDILITNDDGILSKGIIVLAQNLAKNHSVTVVAPQVEMSGASHSFTIFTPLFVHRAGQNGGPPAYVVNGTPSDCVKIGIRKLLKKKPDLLISGINSGENTGVSSFYSGTVAGAREGAFFGVKSVSVSLSRHSDEHYRHAVAWVTRFVGRIAGGEIDFDPWTTYLNVNFPACSPAQIRGVKITRQGVTPFNDDYEERTNPSGIRYFWLFGDKPGKNDAGADEKAIEEGFITVTPLSVDMTDGRFIEKYSGKPDLF